MALSAIHLPSKNRYAPTRILIPGCAISETDPKNQANIDCSEKNDPILNTDGKNKNRVDTSSAIPRKHIYTPSTLSISRNSVLYFIGSTLVHPIKKGSTCATLFLYYDAMGMASLIFGHHHVDLSASKLDDAIFECENGIVAS